MQDLQEIRGNRFEKLISVIFLIIDFKILKMKHKD
jgi:hypothetical protein